MGHEDQEGSRLCYLSPAHVEWPLPDGRLDVCDRDNRRIGNFAGLIFEPQARRLRYLVLDVPELFKHRRYLVPIDPTQIDAEHRSLRVGIDGAALAGCMNFDPRVFPDFSDADLIEALFTPDEPAWSTGHKASEP